MSEALKKEVDDVERQVSSLLQEFENKTGLKIISIERRPRDTSTYPHKERTYIQWVKLAFETRTDRVFGKVI